MANEKRLISVEDTVRQLQHEIYWNDSTKAAIRAFLRTVPAVDAVEVVRCKDCRFCKKHPTSDKVKMCTNEQQWATECYPLVHDDDFCSYGERKGNEKENRP